MKKILTVLARTIYGGVVLAVVALTLLFIGTKIDFFGYEARVVKSGSMEPAIMTGSIVIIQETRQYAVGDIATYETARGSLPVTHRIIAEDTTRRTPYYTTKGDANEDIDPLPVARPQMIGKVVFSLPYFGYAIEFARTPLGFALLIGIPAAIIVLDEFADIMWEIHKYRHSLKARTRQGKVGYRTPARNRQPREQQRTQTKAPLPRQRLHPRREPERTLDLRHYELKQGSS